VTKDDSERVKGLSTHLIGTQKIVAPRLVSKIDAKFESFGIADATETAFIGCHAE